MLTRPGRSRGPLEEPRREALGPGGGWRPWPSTPWLRALVAAGGALLLRLLGLDEGGGALEPCCLGIAPSNVRV